MSEIRACDPYSAKIYIAGDYSTALDTCRKFFFERGGCVNVQPTEYVYTGGQEAGVIVEVINYARFPAEPKALYELAHELAEVLRVALCQHSYTVVTPIDSVFVSHRVSA